MERKKTKATEKRTPIERTLQTSEDLKEEMRETLLRNPQVRRLGLQGCQESRRGPGTPGPHLPGRRADPHQHQGLRGTRHAAPHLPLAGTPRCKEAPGAHQPWPHARRPEPPPASSAPRPRAYSQRSSRKLSSLSSAAHGLSPAEKPLFWQRPFLAIFIFYHPLLKGPGRSSRLHYQPWTNHLSVVLNSVLYLMGAGENGNFCIPFSSTNSRFQILPSNPPASPEVLSTEETDHFW